MKKYIAPILGISILIVGLVVAVLLSKQIAINRNNAAVTGGAGKLILSPQATTLYTGQIIPVDVLMNTGGALISSTSFRITYPYSGTTPALDVVDQTGAASTQISADPTLLSTGDWSFPVRSITKSGGVVTIDFAAADTNIAGYSTSTNVKLARFYLKVNAVTGSPVSLTFDPTISKMLTKSTSTDILSLPTNGSYTLTIDTFAPIGITDLSGTLANNVATLSWTSPSDLGPTGGATAYDIRYLNSAINSSNFSTGIVVPNIPIPATTGTSQSMTVNLNSGLIYYFAIESRDAAGNVSVISNVVAVSTIIATPTPSPSPTPTPSPTPAPTCGSVCTATSAWPTGMVCINSSGGTVTSTQSGVLRNSLCTASINCICPTPSPSPSPTPTPVITPSPTPSPSPTPNVVMLNFKFKLQGLVNQGSPTTVSLILKNGSTVVYTNPSVAALSNATGLYSGSQSAGIIPVGTYDVYIKEPTHLQKKFASQSIIAGSNTIDMSATPLLAGDFNNDNFIDVLDFGKFLAVYTQLTTPTTSSNKIYDVNNDGVIDILDIALPLSNYTTLEVAGD